MRKLILLAALLSAPAFAVTSDGKFDQREKELLPNCEGMGGCAVISRAQLEQYIAALHEQWADEVREQFKEAVKAEAATVCKKTI